MKRRTFLKKAGMSLCAVGAARIALGERALAGPPPSAKRPNLLIITTDQQIADGLSCLGNPYLKTPAMDGIAANGVIFRKAYVAQPLCMPCRMSIQTGRYPHETGVIANGLPATTRFPMLGRALADAGYDCAYFGKWHIAVDAKKDEKAHGYALVGRGKDSDLPAQAADFLKKKREKPFFLTASFVNPHNVCQLARREELPDGPIPPTPPPDQCPPLPDNFAIPADEPSAIREVQKMHSGFQYPVVDWTDNDWRQYLWGYYRLIEKVDGEVGRALEALRASGQEENTLIVFTSDHGEGVASHHWNQKQILYDQTARVPFILSWKGVTKAGAVDASHLVSTGIDIFPTLLDFAGVAIPADLPGKSLRALALGQDPGKWRDFVVTETAFASNAELSGVSGRMVRTDRYKYIVYNKGENREQLFDMEKDPGEKTNLAGSAALAAVLKDHRAKLRAWCEATKDDFPVITE